MLMKISIIIPIYNVELYIERCLQSVMAQTYQSPLECLLVDDCGTDKSMDVVERLLANYSGSILFKILRHKNNRGLSAARNTGMEAATGDYLFFLDSDDEIKDNCIEALAKPLKEETYDIVVGDIQTIGDEKKKSFLSLKLNDGEILRGKEIVETYRNKWNMMAQNKLYRTAFIREQKLRFKEGLIHEDELWSLQVACLAKSLMAVKQFTYLYYIKESGIMSSRTKDRSAKMYMVIVVEMRNFLIDRKMFSAKAYRLISFFFFQSLKPSLYNKYKLTKDYSQLRRAVRFPFGYRIMAGGLNLNTQIKNIVFLLPPNIASRLIYWYAHHVNTTVLQ